MADATQALEHVWRDQWGRLLALLVAQYRRLDVAEDGLAEAFEAAVRTWDADGIPDNPAAWLLTAARRRVLDRLRAEAVAARKEPLLVVDAEVSQRAARVMADPGGLVEDERLRLVFLCAHPALEREAASALTLRLVLGVPTEDVARLFLVSRPTMAARLTRAKRRLAVTGAPFRVPSPRSCRDGWRRWSRSGTSRSPPAMRPRRGRTSCELLWQARGFDSLGCCVSSCLVGRCWSCCWP